MLFHSYDFLFLFLPVVLGAFALLDRSARHAGKVPLLLGASLVFYACWDWRHLSLLAASIIFNYGWARLLQRRSPDPPRGLLAAGVAVNLLALGLFKYADFAIENVNRALALDIAAPALALPLGISFYTLQQIAFLVDVRNGLTAVPGFAVYALFVSFFPQVTAGPIVRARQLIPQLAAPAHLSVTAERLANGFGAIALGLFKKVVVADLFGAHAETVFAHVHQPGFFDAWGGALAFAMQIYFDFSAYADIAIGVGRLFNIELPENFDSPYKARNIADFWRRWHMTLSSFLRDYIFIPLARRGTGKSQIEASLVITFLLAGIWHGAAWTFVVWGALNALYTLVYQRRRRALPAPLAWATTFVCVVAAMVVFRAPSLARAAEVLLGMVGAHGFVWRPAVLSLNRDFFLRLLIALLVVLWAPNRRQLEAKPLIANDAWAAFALALLLGIAIIEIGAPDPFVYFQF